MNSPSKDPVKPNTELDYAPPWAREPAARESARDPMRPVLGEPVALPAEQRAENKLVSWANRNPGDDRAWHQRALDPELVPEPPAGVSNVWPTMLRLGIVCAIAATVAAAVVLLFNPKQTVHRTAQVNAAPSSLTADDRTPPLVNSARIVPGLVAPGLVAQGLADAGSSIASAPPPQIPPAQANVAAPPPQAIASLPPPNQSPANVETPPASTVNQSAVNEPAANPPAVNRPTVSPAEANSAASEAPSKVQTAAVPPTQPASSSIARQNASSPVALDDSEIAMLIKRGNSLLKDGDFTAARLVFERGADAGSAEAALALGSTYDPLVIKRLGAIMVRPDVENARKWYQIAADRGSADAKLQLANLPQSR
jgi:hypothetical protein